MNGSRPTTTASKMFYREEDVRGTRLTADEERSLGTAARAGDTEARDRLVRANLRLVVTIARGFVDRGLPLEDLVGEGNLGLIRAAAEFDPRFGVRFSTYAAHWIRQAIRHALITTAAPVRLPAHMVRLLTAWRRAEREFMRVAGRPPSFEELAASLGLTDARRRMLERALLATRAANSGESSDDPSPLREIVANESAPWVEVQEEDRRRDLLRRVERLDERERLVLRLRYGLDGDGPKTLRAVGRTLGVTHECVRKIEKRALAELSDEQPVGVSARSS